ncbi:calmodulin-binding transcription activator 3-like isoform X2 [Olea europaea subsp. europaea]|uniref:Calmodulin-binding transcription activator 3-like isoform X2 n=1 Tax=Olea europaea subsp. europaea TaxID=158383 RepID=A0A8S0T1R8_OLEEU|nr:calmodulin-binding transcription activator 3-like isoform X2 [Olea europaea subsp. europaea]
MAGSLQNNAQLGMPTDLRFTVSYGGDFVKVDDEWKWEGYKTTSLLVPRYINVVELVVRLREKLRIHPSTQIKLKFKVPNMNVPPAEIQDNDELNWYITFHKENALYVSLCETEVPNGLHTVRETEMEDPTFVTKEDIGQIHLKAQHQWLCPAEICEILRNYKKTILSPEPSNRPPSGSLFLFDRNVQRHFRKDGHNWRKKNGKTVKEGNEKLKVGGIDALHCYYAHGEEDQNFKRRIYWMLEKGLSHIVLVHYLEVKENRTNFDCIRESEVIPDSQKPRENIHNSEVDSSVFSEFRPYYCEGIFQVMDSSSHFESVYCQQQSPGFQSFDNVPQPVVKTMRDGSIPYCDVPILGPTLSQDQLFSIDEFSPNWAYAGSEIKVFIMGKFLRSHEEVEKYKWSCMFGELEVLAEIIADGVLCCSILSQKTGTVPFYVTCSNRLACSEVREFEFRTTDVQEVDIADAGSVISSETVLLRRFAKLLDLGSVQTPVQKGAAENDFCCKINSLLKDDNVWEQMLNLSTRNEFSADRVQDLQLKKLLKKKLCYRLLQKVAEGGKGPKILDEGGQGVLHFAAALGYDWAIQPTIAAGVSVNFRDANGWTALHWAAYYGRERMVAFLISIGASPGALTDPTPQCPSGRTPADLASCNGHKGIAGYLAESALSDHLASLDLKNSKEVNNEEKAVETVSERTATLVGYGDLSLSLKDSLAAVCNATQAAARIRQVFRVQSFQRKQTKEHGDGEFGMSDERVLSLLSVKGKKTGRHDEPMHSAAISIQNKFRSWKGRKEYLLIRQRIKIQAHVRGHQVRKNYKMIIWSVGILDKVILRWRRKGRGLRSFKPEALTAGTSMQVTEPKEDDYDFLKEGRKQTEERLQKALARVKSMVQYPEARDQYRRLLSVASEMQETKGKYDRILNNPDVDFFDMI